MPSRYRFGVFAGNTETSSAEWLDPATFESMTSVVITMLLAPTPTASKQGVRQAVLGVIGNHRSGEDDDWFYKALMNHAHDWPEAARMKLVELFNV